MRRNRHHMPVDALLNCQSLADNHHLVMTATGLQAATGIQSKSMRTMDLFRAREPDDSTR